MHHLQLVELGPEERLVHENLLDGVAGGGVVGLGIHNDPAGLIDVGRLVDVDVADAIRMTHHRDLGVCLDVAHQRVAAPGNHLR